MNSDHIESRLKAKPRVLIVDDDHQVVSVLITALAEYGVETTVAFDPAEARAGFKAAPPQIALIDQMLPGALGTDLIREFSAQDPLLMQFLATGASDTNLLKTALSSGAWSILRKPYRLTDVFEIVEQWNLYNDLARLNLAASNEASADREFQIRVDTRSSGSLEAQMAWEQTFVTQHDSPMARRTVTALCLEVVSAARDYALRSGSAIDIVAKSCENEMVMEIEDPTGRIDWKKELARSRGNLESSRVTGLFLISCMNDETTYTDNGGLRFRMRLQNHHA